VKVKTDRDKVQCSKWEGQLA